MKLITTIGWAIMGAFALAMNIALAFAHPIAWLALVLGGTAFFCIISRINDD